MAVTVITERDVLSTAQAVCSATGERLWIASAWIRADALRALVGDLSERCAEGLDVRVVYRVKEAADLDITELDALDRIAAAGAKVRFSRRLHAKTVIGDSSAVVTSSNLTPTAGYSSSFSAASRNEELGVLLTDDQTAVDAVAAEFLAIWDAAESLDETVRGVAMVESIVEEFAFVVTTPVRVGEYVTAMTPDNDLIVGRVCQITAYNPSFPELHAEATAKPAWNAGRKARPIPAVGDLFADRSKNRGLLITTTFFNADSLFHVADVEVLKQQHRHTHKLTTPSVPVSPGSLVRHADPQVLSLLLNGDLHGSGTYLGTVRHHPEVPVSLNTERLRTLHVAVLGMTGSGKSNAVKNLVTSLLANEPNERIVIVDTHGEYAAITSSLSSGVTRFVDVRLRTPILDEDMFKTLCGLRTANSAVEAVVEEVIDELPEYADVASFLLALDIAVEELAGESKPSASEKTVIRALRKLRERAETRADQLCLRDEDAAVLIDPATDEQVAVDEPGLWICNLRGDDDSVSRSLKCAAIATHIYQKAKNDTTANEPWRALLVIDEAHNYAPERHTGQESRTRGSIDALHKVAAEGRKFRVGLVLATQRPARLSKEILAQCNTQIVFRLTNAEDQAAVAATLETASTELVNQLAGLDTGTCLTSGAAIAMPTQIELTLHESN